MEANLAWADCMKITTGYGKRLASTPLGVQAAIGKELFFMTILMLHACVPLSPASFIRSGLIFKPFFLIARAFICITSTQCQKSTLTSKCVVSRPESGSSSFNRTAPRPSTPPTSSSLPWARSSTTLAHSWVSCDQLTRKVFSQ